MIFLMYLLVVNIYFYTIVYYFSETKTYDIMPQAPSHHMHKKSRFALVLTHWGRDKMTEIF